MIINQNDSMYENAHTPVGPMAAEKIIEGALLSARTAIDFEVSVYFSAISEDDLKTSFVLKNIQGQDSEYLKALLLGCRLFGTRTGTFGKAMEQGRTAWSDDYTGERDTENQWINVGLHSVILTPVRDDGRVVGHLGVLSFGKPTQINLVMRRSLESVAAKLGRSLEQSRLDHDVDGLLKNGGLKAIGLALESRGLEPVGHTERVARFAEMIGKVMGMSLDELEDLRQGAYLHDIGKLAVSMRVQLKPGPLDLAEWGAVQMHTIRGFEMASRISNISQGALEVVYHHHERWDGTGYPDRLCGEAIPLSARICTVCDVFDTLMSNRPYKHALGIDAALQELQSQSCKQLDPIVVETFLELTIGKLIN